MDSSNLGDFILSILGDVSLHPPCPAWASVCGSCIASFYHVASSSVLNACMSFRITWILMSSSSQRLWVHLLTDTLIACTSICVFWMSVSSSSTHLLMLPVNSVWVYWIALIMASIFSWPALISDLKLCWLVSFFFFDWPGWWLSSFLHWTPFHSWMALRFSWAVLNSSFSWSKLSLISCYTRFISIIHQSN